MGRFTAKPSGPIVWTPVLLFVLAGVIHAATTEQLAGPDPVATSVLILMAAALSIWVIGTLWSFYFVLNYPGLPESEKAKWLVLMVVLLPIAPLLVWGGLRADSSRVESLERQAGRFVLLWSAGVFALVLLLMIAVVIVNLAS